MLLPPPRRLTTLVLAVAGGGVTDAAFPQRGFWPLAVLGIALLALGLARDSARWAFLVGLTWGVTFFGIHLWFTSVAVGPVPWAALTLAMGAFVGAFGAAWTWIRRWRPATNLLLGTVLFALAWTAFEALRSVVPFGGFPWGRIAFSQTTGPLLRLASLGGTALVSSLVAALGFAVAAVWQRLRAGRPAAALVPVLAVLLVPVAALAVPLPTQAEAGTVRVGAVQGNVPNAGLDAFANAREVTRNHRDQTLTLVGQDVDVVLWPENSTDYDPRTDDDAAAVVTEASDAVGVPILIGTQSYLYDEEGSVVGRHNDMVRWDPGVGPVAVYAKQRPAPFAEYIPLREIARRFSSAVDRVRVDMVGGTEPGVLDLPVGEREVPFGIAICFEVAYDEIVAESVREGAEVLVVPTNNATFGESAQSEQQLAMSVFRAVEHGRATVQISTVGVSAIITPNGVVTERTELFTAGTMVADLPLRTTITPATVLAPWGTFLAYGVTGIALVLGIVAGRRRPDPQQQGKRRPTTRRASA